MKIKILSFLLLSAMLLSLISCGGTMSDYEKSTPDHQKDTSPVESDLKKSYGLLHPPLVEYDYENIYPGIEIVDDRETMDAYREQYYEALIEAFRIYWQYPEAVDIALPQLLDYHEDAVNAFALYESENFFEKNYLILVGINSNGLDIIDVSTHMTTDANGKEKLQICLTRENGHISFASNETPGSITVIVAISKNVGIQSAEDVIVSEGEFVWQKDDNVQN